MYRLATTVAANQKPLSKEDKTKKTRHVSLPFLDGKCSSKAKNHTSGKSSVSGSKTVEKGTSENLSINKSVAVPRRTEEMTKDRLDEKSPQRSQSKLKSQLMSPSLLSDEQKEQAQNVLKRRCTAKESPRTGKYSNTVKTRELSKTIPIPNDLLPQNKGDQVKELSPSKQNIKFKITKRPCTEVKTPLASFASSKDTTSFSTLNAVKNVTSVPGNAKSVSHEMAKSSSSPQRSISSIKSTLPLNFKIPKMFKFWPVDSTERNPDAIFPNRNVTEPSNSGTSLSRSKQTVHHARKCVDLDPCLSSDRQDERPSSSGQLPATSDTASSSWCDEVVKSIIQSLIEVIFFKLLLFTNFFHNRNNCLR